MRILFAGSPAIAIPTLEALLETKHEVCGVLTQPPQPVGRHKEMTPTPVHRAAETLNLDVRTPQSRGEILDAVIALKPDLAVVVAYGKILARQVLDEVPQGWWNVHFSLLPRWRGAAPVQHAILNGDERTGVTVFRIGEGLDEGPIASQWEHAVDPDDTTSSLLERLSGESPRLVLELLDRIDAGTLEVHEQEGEPTFAPKLSKEAGLLRLSLPAQEVYQRFRAVTPEPGAKIVRADTSQTVSVLQAHLAQGFPALQPGELKLVDGVVLVGTGTAPLVLEQVQPAGKRPMSAVDWWRGLPEGVSCDVSP